MRLRVVSNWICSPAFAAICVLGRWLVYFSFKNTGISTQVPIEKCEKSGHVNDEDRISNLPECLISGILSCLPTKDAVRTCVLSKDWKFKWTSIYNIDIDDTGVDLNTFPIYLEMILFLPQYVRNFRLHCQKDYPVSRMARWISAVLRRNVESLEVIYRAKQDVILLPRSLLDTTSLRILKLELPCTFKVPSKNCFPNLSSLHLEGVEIQNELLPNSDTLIFTFPVLETLKFIECIWLNVKFVEIHAPQLKNFRSQTPCDPRKYDYSIEILADRLEHFECYGGFPENLILTESSVVGASFHNFYCSMDPRLAGFERLRSLLEGFQSLEHLKLQGEAWVLALAKRGPALPRYDKLLRLTLCGCLLGFKSLMELLHTAPSLKSLRIGVHFNTIWPDNRDYEEVQPLPSCIVNHLEEVELIYSGEVLVSEYRLEKIFMKNGLRLKTFHLRGGYHNKNEVLKLFSTFPKGSTCLKIVVT